MRSKSSSSMGSSRGSMSGGTSGSRGSMSQSSARGMAGGGMARAGNLDFNRPQSIEDLTGGRMRKAEGKKGASSNVPHQSLEDLTKGRMRKK